METDLVAYFFLADFFLAAFFFAAFLLAVLRFSEGRGGRGGVGGTFPPFGLEAMLGLPFDLVSAGEEPTSLGLACSVVAAWTELAPAASPSTVDQSGG